MKKAQSLIAGCLLSLALVQASAVSYQDQDLWTPEFDANGNFIPNVGPASAILFLNLDLRSIPPGPSDTSGTDSRGYDPLTQQILSAVVSIQIFNDGDGETHVTQVLLESVNLLETWSGSGVLFGTDPSNAVQMALLVAALQDGFFLNPVITALAGDFFVSSVTLTAEVGDRQPPSSVPDGGSTLGLLGAALVGLEAARRRFAR